MSSANAIQSPSRAGTAPGVRVRIRLVALASLVSLLLVLASSFNENWLLLRASQLLPVAAIVAISAVRRNEAGLLVAVLILVTLFLINILIYGELYLEGFYPVAIGALGVISARSLRAYPVAFPRLIAAISVALSLLFLVRVFLYRVSPNALVDGSRNQVATIILSLGCVAVASAVVSLREPFSVPYVRTASAATAAGLLILTSRAGLVAGAIMGLIALLYRARSRIYLRLGVVLLSLGVVVVLGGVSPSQFVVDLPRAGYDKFQAIGYGSVRWDIWDEMASAGLRQENWAGLPPNWAFERTGLSSHSSYLEIMSIYGIAGLLFVAGLSVAALVTVTRRRPVLGILLGVLLFRAAFDAALLGMLLGPSAVFIWLISGYGLPPRSRAGALSRTQLRSVAPHGVSFH